MVSTEILYIFEGLNNLMDEWISVTLLLGSASSFAIDCIAALESLNITAFSKDPILPNSCIKAVFIDSISPSK
jgi:hypothetical protein